MTEGSSTSAILVAGPTASGKSALALELAERFGGIVINADSMQVYRELRVLTARPTSEEEARVPHVLYGHVPAHEPYSAGRFVREVRQVLAEAERKRRVPIIVGGTGLYFKSLLDGLSPIPEVAEEVRAHWRGEAERIGVQGLHRELMARDPEMAARLAPTDTQRMVRALEVLTSSGRSLAYWQALPGTPILKEGRLVKLVVTRAREELHRRAEARFDQMMQAGALAEVAELACLGIPDELPAMRALGVRALRAHLNGALDLEAAVEAAKAETRQFIKRQQTWLKRHMISWNWLSAQQMQSICATVLPFIHS